MYHKAYGIIETLAPLHVGASAGEETGNLNLIFRDQFTQTGIIPGSSIRGRFRADMRLKRQQWLEQSLAEKGLKFAEANEDSLTRWQWLENKAKEVELKVPKHIDGNNWYGHEAITGREDGGTTEALVKFEYASLVWLPVFCPGQPVVWISCPRLLKRYKQIARIDARVPEPYTASKTLIGRRTASRGIVLFFNLGFLEIEHEVEPEVLEAWIPPGTDLTPSDLVVVGDNDIAMLHDMALYRQSRVKLSDTEKKVEGGGFFNVEALPEGSIFIFPIALKETGWQPFLAQTSQELYFGGLESIGFGHCHITLQGV
jgi:CRISPR-associated protein Cmr4